ncbi:hypothetical protein DICSQDRAFT_53381 [Dichomitus squalens LYAD-421 SS1]|uniref:uncharacterized protein n=1 Tax=Dichomitus squalens (strain LYAD-421) TaxID=732165 RepID=UPI000441466E|nr:uncharacterized protein DICSQDRAFT_53381 [Dichomitus squalens LYAD-421 SS1]EJF64305.1 hypothetical protein DICSQDRAFT_53381 [Dichomitus squalens LYAD-421 SS1]
MSDTPSWPSLYDPLVELFPLDHRDAVQRKGRYLSHPYDVFRFTLYWTLVLYVPSFIICGAYAFFNLSLPPRRPNRRGYKVRPGIASGGPSFRSAESENIPLRRYGRQLGAGGRSQLRLPTRAPAKQNETRSRLTFAVLVFMLFATFALGGAVVGSAIIGYVLAGLYKAGKYHMSTCVPLLVRTLLFAPER